MVAREHNRGKGETGERQGRGRDGNERRVYEVCTKKMEEEEDGTDEVRLCKER